MTETKSILVLVLPLCAFLFGCSCLHSNSSANDLLNELEVVIVENENAREAKDLDGLRATIHEDSNLWRNTTKYWEAIKADNFSTKLISFSFMSRDRDIAIARARYSTKEKYSEYENDSLIIFRKTFDEWKIWSSVSLEKENTIK